MSALKHISKQRVTAFQELYLSMLGVELSSAEVEKEIGILSELIFQWLITSYKE